MKYLQGHIPRAVNLPTSRIFDKGTLELLPIERLAGLIGDSEIDGDRTVLVCDDHDGQNEAMHAAALKILDHLRRKHLSSFSCRSTIEKRPDYYRPATLE